MAYRFKLKERARDGVRRMCVEQLDKALAAPHTGEHRAGWVHETRKSIKRLRSLLRLVQSGMPRAIRREANAELRRIARSLSGIRDRDVMRATLASLAAGSKDADLAAAAAWLDARLDQPAEASGAVTGEAITDAIATALADLATARDDLGRIEIDGDLVTVLADGLARCQRRGQKALARLACEPTDEHVHELRKAVQTFQRQQSLIVAIWPEAQAVRIATARALAQELGEAQDLAVLAAFAAGHRHDEKKLADRLTEACRSRQSALLERAMPIAERLFATPADAVAREFEDGWKAAVRLSRLAKSA